MQLEFPWTSYPYPKHLKLFSSKRISSFFTHPTFVIGGTIFNIAFCGALMLDVNIRFSFYIFILILQLISNVFIDIIFIGNIFKLHVNDHKVGKNIFLYML